MPDVKLPLVGNVPRGALVMGGGAAVVVTGYLIYRHNKQSTLATAYGYGAAGYGYGSQQSAFYGYGFNYGDYSGAGGGGGGGGGMTPYPVGAEYGYGAYGYGYYNPYTGQWIGPTQQTPPGAFQSKPAVKGPKFGKSKWITIKGKRYFYNVYNQTLTQQGKHKAVKV